MENNKVNSIFMRLPKQKMEKLTKMPFPEWINPMIPTLGNDCFDDENWMYERKLDGVRIMVYNSGENITLKSRIKTDLNKNYPELVDALKKGTQTPYIADGEVVAFDGSVSSFSELQKRIYIADPDEARQSDVKVYLYLFDLVYFAGYDLTKLDLRSRKSLLKKALSYEDPIRYTVHINRDGTSFHDQAAQKGWEGIVAKDGRAPYIQTHSEKWLKFKFMHRQEFVVGGYTDPDSNRIGFNGLLVGYYQDGELQYAGQVGTGFDYNQTKKLHKKLVELEQSVSPFKRGWSSKKTVHWVEPELIIEVAFSGWTHHNKLNHARFLGIRRDKKPNNVQKEKAKDNEIKFR